MIKRIHWGDLAVPLILFSIANAGNFDWYWIYIAFGLIILTYFFYFTKPFNTFLFPICFLHFLLTYSIAGLTYLIFKNLFITIIITLSFIFLFELDKRIKKLKERYWLKSWEWENLKIDFETGLNMFFDFLGLIIFLIFRR